MKAEDSRKKGLESHFSRWSWRCYLSEEGKSYQDHVLTQYALMDESGDDI
jgi:hypothetical protein